ncbi:hypothetical protein B0H19DRAFT_1014432 [Mycena capillaripes]|nr:hypothetical protein B0H19DRAFT_1014432 [Mycena capillaripes]
MVVHGNLVALHVYGCDDWSVLWHTLRELRIPLKNIETNVVTTDLLIYLSLYSGLEKLSLEECFFRTYGGTRSESDHLADVFLQTVIPRHAESLVKLACPTIYESRWSFGPHNVDAISSLHKLTSLEMSIN